MKAAGRTDSGLRRDNNEDALYVSKEPVGIFDMLLIVADGMGGHSYGEVASTTALSTVLSFIKTSPVDTPFHILDQAISLSNLEVRKAAEKLHSYQMGTTLVIVGIIGRHCYVASVGDSRAYLLNEKHNTLRQITTDHTTAEEMVKRGLLIRGSVEYKEKVHELTRAIGPYSETYADFFDFPLFPGDILLTCSDGLYNMLDAKTIRLLASDNSFDLKKRVDTLIDEANRRGGLDNITVAIGDPEVTYD